MQVVKIIEKAKQNKEEPKPPVKVEKKKPVGKTSKKRTQSKPKKKDNKKSDEKQEINLMGLTSATKNMEKLAEYAEFIKFIALPRVLREDEMKVGTQEAFAKKFGVNEWTLVEWKKRIGFWEDVHEFRKQFFKGRAGDVWLALENTCIKKGQGADVKVYFTLTGDYQEKTLEEQRLDPSIKKAIDKIGDFLDKSSK